MTIFAKSSPSYVWNKYLTSASLENTNNFLSEKENGWPEITMTTSAMKVNFSQGAGKV